MSQVGGIQLAGLGRQPAGHVRVTNQGDAVLDDHLIGFGQFTVTALLSGQVNHHAAVFHAFHHLGGPQFRRGPARDQGGGNHDIDVFCLLGEQRHFGRDEFIAHDLGVAALARTVLIFEVQHQELGAHTLHLLLHLRPGVEGTYDGAHATGGANGSQPGNTGANHQHLGWGYLAGSRNLPGKKPPKMLRRLNHCPVTCNVGHGTQGIELLGTRDAGHTVHGHGGHAALGELFQQFRVLGRPQETDQCLA